MVTVPTLCLCEVATIVAYLKEVESPYAVLDFIRSYLGDTVEAKEFAKQFLERRAKQKANQQRQQVGLSCTTGNTSLLRLKQIVLIKKDYLYVTFCMFRIFQGQICVIRPIVLKITSTEKQSFVLRCDDDLVKH